MADEITFFAETNYRGQNVRFGIKIDDRRRHMYLIGKTGMGKTTMLEHMVYADIVSGNGLALVDPHGDFAEKILNYIPSNRINDVVYFNPSDTEWPIAFNVMESIDPKFMPLVASGLIGVFKKIWADTWGPRLEYVLRNSILALLEYPGSTLLGVPRILIDKTYRAKIVKKITDPVVRSFWVDEFSRYPDKFQTEAISPIQNKIGQFLSSSMVRNIISQTKSSIDLREIMDNRKILIVNLAKGRIGEDYSALIGAMMITKLQLSAMGRVDTPEYDRKDFYLYVDEFQNFATESFANILSEARKYRLNLIIAHQYIGQLVNGQNTVVRDAVFGNVGTIVTFRVGAADAEFLEKEFEPTFMMNDLVNLPKYNVYMKLMIDGVTSEAFSARTLPPLGPEVVEGNADKIIKNSRQRYATARHIIEEKIARWSEVTSANSTPGNSTGNGNGANKIKRPSMNAGTLNSDLSGLSKFSKPQFAEVSPEKKYNRDAVPTMPAPVKNEPLKSNMPQEDKRAWYDAVCQKCAKQISVPFKPDPARKTYCRDCLRLIRMNPAEAQSMMRPSVEREKKYEKNITEVKLEEIKAEKIRTEEVKTESRRPEVQMPAVAEEAKPEKFISLAEAVKATPVSFSSKSKPENISPVAANAEPEIREKKEAPDSGVKKIPRREIIHEKKEPEIVKVKPVQKSENIFEQPQSKIIKKVQAEALQEDKKAKVVKKGKLKPKEKARFE